MKKFFIFLIGLILLSIVVSADEELLIPMGGDSEFYLDSNADEEMNFFTDSPTNLTINLISPANGTIFKTTLDVDITFQFTSTNPHNRTLNFTIYINGKANQSALNVSNFTINFNQAGTYTWYVIVNDGVSSATSETRTFNIQELKPGGGGGGGGGSSEFVSLSKTWEYIEDNAKWELTHPDIPITEVFFITERIARNVELKIIKKNPPVFDKYHSFFYCEFVKKNIEDIEIIKVIIKFKVLKSWLNKNNIGKDDIVLKRYIREWKELPTKVIGEDDLYYYYEAESSGFSYFSIGQKAKPEKITTEVIVPLESPQKTIPESKEQQQLPLEEQKKEEIVTLKQQSSKHKIFLFYLLIGLLLFFIVLILIILIYKKNRDLSDKNYEKRKIDAFLENIISPPKTELDRLLNKLEKEDEEEKKL